MSLSSAKMTKKKIKKIINIVIAVKAAQAELILLQPYPSLSLRVINIVCIDKM